jgi:hypothetical protein
LKTVLIVCVNGVQEQKKGREKGRGRQTLQLLLPTVLRLLLLPTLLLLLLPRCAAPAMASTWYRPSQYGWAWGVHAGQCAGLQAGRDTPGQNTRSAQDVSTTQSKY